MRLASPASAFHRVARFATAGLINTLVDYTAFLCLTFLLRLSIEDAWIAKLGSGSLAMAGSFALNRRWVFRSEAGGSAQVLRFVVVSLIGTFGVQLGGLHLLMAIWPGPGELAASLAQPVAAAVGLGAVVSTALVQRTFAFGVATLASMTWNYLAYRRWVFAARPPLGPLASGRPA